MKFSTSVIAAAAAFLPAIEAHMRITIPAPYNGADNAPLDPSGSNFPCMVPGNYPQIEPKTVYNPGESCSFKITGGATHGGGSCQVSITYDEAPTADSVFKVVKSWHGGCPTESNTENKSNEADDDSIDPFSFTLPEGLKSGKATFVWTWFNRIGNREMYMNCAPIMIGGNNQQDTVFDSLPDMFVANIEGGQCTTKEREDIEFPNPGDQLDVATTGKDLNLQPACAGQTSTSPKKPATGKSGNVSNPPPSNNYGDSNQQTPPPSNDYESGNNNNQGTPSNDGSNLIKKPVLVDVGNQEGVVNNPPSDSYEDINGGNNSGNNGGSSPPPPPSDDYDSGDNSNNSGNNTGYDDNTGSQFGHLCPGEGSAMVCDGAPSGKFVQCFGRNKGWAYAIPGGLPCSQYCSSFNPPSPPAKFKRHAFEHAKRLARRHQHRF